jgi:predicted nucleotidyltransferase
MKNFKNGSRVRKSIFYPVWSINTHLRSIRNSLWKFVVCHQLRLRSGFCSSIIIGSYRRGKKDCGDIDVLLAHKTNRPIDRAMERLIDALTEIGFLTDHLTDPHKSKENDKYMGKLTW